ncbi:hypothetical protein B0I60_000591 [Clostridium beijerinckii]|nr:hypothetical protein [Clostridium beijerinckii]NYC17185.1 hypothetical protein [Clostridium beijerinckii]
MEGNMVETVVSLGLAVDEKLVIKKIDLRQ